MEKATNKKLCQSVKVKADKIYARPGLFKSAYIRVSTLQEQIIKISNI